MAPSGSTINWDEHCFDDNTCVEEPGEEVDEEEDGWEEDEEDAVSEGFIKLAHINPVLESLLIFMRLSLLISAVRFVPPFFISFQITAAFVCAWEPVIL